MKTRLARLVRHPGAHLSPYLLLSQTSPRLYFQDLPFNWMLDRSTLISLPVSPLFNADLSLTGSNKSERFANLLKIFNQSTAYFAVTRYTSFPTPSTTARMNINRLDGESFIVDQVLHANIVDLSKKRKLIDTQFSLPIRKLNFREESPGSEESSNYSGEPVANDVLQALFTKASGNLHQDYELLQPDSEMDSNSFIEESEGAVSESTEAKSETEISKVSTYNHPVKYKRDISEVYTCDEASSSSGSFGSNYTKDVLCSIDHRSFKKVDNKETKLPVIDQHLEFGNDAELKELLGTEPEDLMLYSNGMSSDMFVLSSGRWKIKQDTQAAIRKPTIDQEFEEYFSSLML